MIPECSGDDEQVPFLRGRIDEGGELPHAARRDDKLVNRSALEHFRITSHDGDAGRPRDLLDRVNNREELFFREAFLDDEAEGEAEWVSAHDEEVIDGPAHGNLADVAARKKKRCDYIAVRGEHEPARTLGANGRIGGLVRPGSAQGEPRAQLPDERLHLLSAAALAETHLTRRGGSERAGKGGRRSRWRGVS